MEIFNLHGEHFSEGVMRWNPLEQFSLSFQPDNRFVPKILNVLPILLTIDHTAVGYTDFIVLFLVVACVSH